MTPLYLLIFLLWSSILQPGQNSPIELKGEWRFKMDPSDIGIKEKWFAQKLPELILLPGSMAENGKGNPVSHQTHWVGNIRNEKWYEDKNYQPYLSENEFLFPYWLISEKHYYGAAWYQKEIDIPPDWDEQHIELFLERCHWETKVWVDDHYIGMQNSLGTSHCYALSKFIKPGIHTLTICVDNRIKEVNVGPNSHSISDHTQSNWNGIVGKIEIIKKPQIRISNIQVFPDVDQQVVSVAITIQNDDHENLPATMHMSAKSLNSKAHIPNPVAANIQLQPGQNEVTLLYPMGTQVKLWDEFSPNLYELSVILKTPNTQDKGQVRFGMRKITTQGTRLAINDRPIFLRGTLECAIFPKTGYPPTDVDAWRRIIRVCQDHGLNHMRFHSWCPPKAAFEAADELGFYYQVECSSWANQGTTLGDGKPIDQWLFEESEQMVMEYGNHPSFIMMAYGNEPGGKNQKTYLSTFVNHWKNKDSRRVYTSGAGWPAIPENDFHNLPQPRIQGWGEGLNSIINGEAPCTDFDWFSRIKDYNVPLISHEIGQWCVYPNLKEVVKYDGVLQATNFEIFKRSLEAHKLHHLADSFLLASGKLQALCYKADIEAALRTPGMAGFQLLDLHDFPGQGTALVGVLDPFWEEKGYISPQEYSRFCNHTVPLVRLEKRIFPSDETLMATMEVAHFGAAPSKNVSATWSLKNEKGALLVEETLPALDIPIGNGIQVGKIEFPLHQFKKPQKLILTANVGTFENHWDIWVYPAEPDPLPEEPELLVVQTFNAQTIAHLERGGNVLLTPIQGSIRPEAGGDVGVGFSSIFWNTAWTDHQKPHTLGILCDPSHPALAEFPTEYHSNWQWWDAMSHANAVLLENFSTDIQPIVRIIDDWVTNRSLGLIFEVHVGKGKLIVTGVDLLTDVDNRPEAKQLLYSLKKYMLSEQFRPAASLTGEEIMELF